jgi:Flp pilus assembly protein CpaB
VPRLRGLPATRHGAIVLAVACAAGAAIILIVALGQYQTSLKTGSKQDTVLVSTGQIQQGTPGTTIVTEKLAKATPILEKSMVPGAITDASLLSGKVAAHNIVPGEQLTLSDFSESGGLDTQLSPNNRAVEVTLDSQHGALQAIQAGDNVDVYGDYDVQPPTGQSYWVTRLLESDVTVLKAPLADGATGASLNSSSSSGGQDVILDMNDKIAAQMPLTGDSGHVWLVLRAPNAKNYDPGLVNLSEILWKYATQVFNGPTYKVKWPQVPAIVVDGGNKPTNNNTTTPSTTTTVVQGATSTTPTTTSSPAKTKGTK